MAVRTFLLDAMAKHNNLIWLEIYFYSQCSCAARAAAARAAAACRSFRSFSAALSSRCMVSSSAFDSAALRTSAFASFLFCRFSFLIVLLSAASADASLFSRLSSWAVMPLLFASLRACKERSRSACALVCLCVGARFALRPRALFGMGVQGPVAETWPSPLRRPSIREKIPPSCCHAKGSHSTH